MAPPHPTGPEAHREPATSGPPSLDGPLRVFAASVQTETNSFSPLRTGDADFAADLHPAGTLPASGSLYVAPVLVARRECARLGWTLHEGLCAGANPGGLIHAATWQRLRDGILDDLQAVGPVDIVVLGLHGAMIADGQLDCEGELLVRVRDAVGPSCAIGAMLDPHCHLTPAMLMHADVLVALKEYPHVDAAARAEEVWALTVATARGEISPRPATFDCRTLGMFFTPVEPVRGIVRAMQEQEGRDGILSVSLIHGFPWGDVPECGARVLAYADGSHDDAGRCAERIGAMVVAARGSTTPRLLSPTEAAALARDWTGDGPLVLADMADNVGGGAPGDATWTLGELLAAGVRGAAAAFVFDPVAVAIAHAAGIGAEIALRVGGKSSIESGPPLDLTVEVRHLARDAHHDVRVTRPPLGDVAAVRTADGADIVLTSKRAQCFGPNAFTEFGIDLADRRVLLVKSAQHFHALFSRIAGRIEYVDSPGAASLDFAKLPYRHVDRTIWPLGPGTVTFADARGASA